MNKLILNPGNGITFPKRGEYVKINLTIYDNKNITLLDTKRFGSIDILFGQNNYITEFEELIGEMSLFEKCSFELKSTKDNDIINKLTIGGNVVAEVEILNISNSPHK
jgi:hypothetical protein